MATISVAISGTTFEVEVLVDDKEYDDERMTYKSMKHMIEQDSDNEAFGELQNKVWKPGTMQMINAVEFEQHDEEMKDQLQCKVWDPRKIKKTKVC